MRHSRTVIVALWATLFSRPGYITRQCFGHRWRLVASFPQFRRALALACLCLLLASGGLAQKTVSPGGDAFFEVLCTLGDDCCSAEAVSTDGSVVVGELKSMSPPGEACIWKEGSGAKGIGVLYDGGPFKAVAVSSDGTVVVGFGDAPVFGDVAFRWEDGEMKDLGTLSGKDSTPSVALDVSADGSVVVGGSQNANGESEAFVWTETAGMFGLGHLHPIGNTGSTAEGVSADGNVIVGRSQSDPMLEEAFRWRADTGMMEGLGSISGAGSSRAVQVSDDGAVVVGQSGSPAQAFRWTEQAGMEGLGFLPGGSDVSRATSVSGDGSVVVGEASTTGGNRAFIWTQSTGMRSLKEALEADYDLDLAGWTLFTPNGLTPDGAYIVGRGSDSNGNTIWWRVFRGHAEPAAAMIDVDPLELSFELESGQSGTRELSISNLGGTQLVWSMEVAADRPWLSVDTPDGAVAPKGSVAVGVGVDAVDLGKGEYDAVIHVTSNDPETLLVEVSVFLTVNHAGPVEDGVFNDRFE